MINSWKKIKKLIEDSEETVSDESWSEMERMLDKRSFRGYLPILFYSLFGLVLTVYFIVGVDGIDNGEIDGTTAPFMESSDQTGHLENDFSNDSFQLAEETEVVEILEKPSPETQVTTSISSTKVDGGSIRQVDETGDSDHLPSENTLRLDLKTPFWTMDHTTAAELKTDFFTPLIPRDKEVGKPMASRLEFRFHMGPSYTLLSSGFSSDPAKTNRSYDQVQNDGLQPGLGMDAGFEVKFRLHKYLKVSTGFGYREIVTRNQYDFTINEVPVLDSISGDIIAYIPLPSGEIQPVSQMGSNMFSYLNIPVSLYYEYPLNDRWILNTELIHHLGILLNQSGSTLDPVTLEFQNDSRASLRKTIGSYQLRLGVMYRLYDNFYLGLEPSYRSFYMNAYSIQGLEWRPSDISLMLTGVIRFE